MHVLYQQEQEGYITLLSPFLGFSVSPLFSSLFLNFDCYPLFGGLPWWLRGKRICLQSRRPGFDPWIGTIPWRREWLPTPVFLPGKSHRQRLQSMGWQRVRHDWAFNTRQGEGPNLMPLWASQWPLLLSLGRIQPPPLPLRWQGGFRWPQALVPNTRGKRWGWLNSRVPTVVLQLCLRDRCICMELCVCTPLCTCRQAGSISRVLYTWSF